MNGTFFSGRGFLFTISIIMFASTLVFFAQNYSSSNAKNETSVVSSVLPMNASFINDDISFGLSRLFGVSFDANEGLASSSLFVSGSVNPAINIESALNSYKSNLEGALFPLTSGLKELDFSDFDGGVARAYFGDAAEFDYDYTLSSVSIYPVLDSSLLELELSINGKSDLNHFEWVSGPSSGSVPVVLDYFDDSNHFSISQSINPAESSVLVLYYADANITVSLGEVGGSSSAIKIANSAGEGFDYSIKANYSSANVLPVVWGARLHYSDFEVDSNSFIVIRK